MLDFAMTHRRRTHHQGTVRHGFGDRGMLDGACEDLGGAYRRAGIAEGYVIGVYDPQAGKAEIAHGAGRSAQVQGVMRGDQDNGETVEMGYSGQGLAPEY
jgi:hypothetical protein